MTPSNPGQFPSTHWSVVLAARRHGSPEEKGAALKSLCETYWYPLYSYVRRRGYDVEEAQDLTQGFLTRLLEKGFLPGAHPERGKFRSYLLGAFKHFLANDWKRSRARKRSTGGEQTLNLPFESGEKHYTSEAIDARTPETIYERRWALTVLQTVLSRLERTYENGGRGDLFRQLRPFLIGEGERGTYSSVAKELSMTEAALKVAIHRLRKRYRELLRAEIAQTVDTPAQIDAELRHLLTVLSA